MIPVYLAPFANHIWQSTVFAAIIALLAFALRKQRAGVRHALWVCASLKFLLPFSLLMAIGGNFHLPVRAAAPQAAPVSRIVYDFVAPAPVHVSTPSIAPSAPDLKPSILLAMWLCGFSAVMFAWLRQWLRVRAIVRSAKPFDFAAPIRVRSTAALMEPGVFGIFRPVLLLPEGITDRLSASEFSSVLAHEIHHVERHDNLWAALHMMVEAMFWFHPLVWWMESTLIAERERACDEEVVRRGSEPEVYAEGILKVCEHYLQSPQLCVAGVSGSDLRKRIDQIMTARIAPRLGRGKKIALAIAGIVAVATPVIIGALDAPRLRAQTSQKYAFEVASVKVNNADSHLIGVQVLPGGRFHAENESVPMLIKAAYNLPFQAGGKRLSGGPAWLDKERFDIDAIAPKDAIADDRTVTAREKKMFSMLQTLLADRFKLVLRREIREAPVYALVVAKNGPKLEKSKMSEEDCPENNGEGPHCHSFNGGMGRGLHGTAVNMDDLVTFVANWSDRPIIDRTGLKGLYAVETPGWAPMDVKRDDSTKGEDGVPWSERPTLFTAMEKLGLKLEAQKAPIEFFIIESVERPTAN